VEELTHELARFGRRAPFLKAQLAGLLPAGLDPAAAQLLAWLIKQGPSRQGELAECTFLDPSTVSRRISQLVQHGLVERRADEQDARAVRLHPTERGQDLFRAFWARREQLVAETVTDWHPDDVDTLVRLLRRLNDDIEARTRSSMA
jgi:DNA-binding MarR family transcriptional regulator